MIINPVARINVLFREQLYRKLVCLFCVNVATSRFFRLDFTYCCDKVNEATFLFSSIVLQQISGILIQKADLVSHHSSLLK